MSDIHLVITDSGLGGLSVCAETEKKLRDSNFCRRARMTYFNAWPEPNQGYNDLPDMPARARVFDKALARIDELRPDLIIIACNTLSVVYKLTEYRRRTRIPVLGIIGAGVDLFEEALQAEPDGSIILFGTRTTIESGVHKEMLMAKGIRRERICAIPCHGLAASIENDPESLTVKNAVEVFVSQACRACSLGSPLYAGLCCTHYTYIRGWFRSELEKCSGRTVGILDPNERLVEYILSFGTREADPSSLSCETSVEVISKIEIEEHKRLAISKRLESISPITASALLSYSWNRRLF